MVKAEDVAEGCVELRDVDWSLGDVETVFVGRAQNSTRLNATAGHGSNPSFGVMVATAVFFQLGSSTELAHPHDQRVVEHASIFKVGNKRCESGVRFTAQVRSVTKSRFVSVPASVEGIAVAEDFDKADTFFDQAACQQATLSETSVTVSVSQSSRLVGQIERLQSWTRQKPRRTVVDVSFFFDDIVRTGSGKLGIKSVGQAKSPLQNVGFESQPNVFWQLTWLLDLEGIVLRSENSRIHIASFDSRIADSYEGWQFERRFVPLVGDD